MHPAEFRAFLIYKNNVLDSVHQQFIHKLLVIMAPPHTQNLLQASKQPRPGPAVKSSSLRSINQARISKNVYIQPSMPTVPTSFSGDQETQLLEQFRLHREEEGHNLIDNAPDEEDEMRRRISYIREQKLAAISYAETTWKQQKNGGLKLISKYAAAANLGITTAMFKTVD